MSWANQQNLRGSSCRWNDAGGVLAVERLAPGDRHVRCDRAVLGDSGSRRWRSDASSSAGMEAAAARSLVGQYAVYGPIVPAIVHSGERLPTISINNASVVEGNSGTTRAVFTVTLSARSAASVSVSYATVDLTANSAGSGRDYLSASGSVTFAPGQTKQAISVYVVGGKAYGSSETFRVNLASPVNAHASLRFGYGNDS